MRFTLDDLDRVGAAIAPALSIGDVIALSGGLGAGKTSLARAILAALGLQGEAPSPSFSIVQTYDRPDVTLPILHVDLYRVDDPADIAELGLDDARRDYALLVEWPERLGRFAWPDMLHLTISQPADDCRHLTARVPPAWEGRWPFPT